MKRETETDRQTDRQTDQRQRKKRVIRGIMAAIYPLFPFFIFVLDKTPVCVDSQIVFCNRLPLNYFDCFLKKLKFFSMLTVS